MSSFTSDCQVKNECVKYIYSMISAEIRPTTSHSQRPEQGAALHLGTSVMSFEITLTLLIELLGANLR